MCVLIDITCGSFVLHRLPLIAIPVLAWESTAELISLLDLIVFVEFIFFYGNLVRPVHLLKSRIAVLTNRKHVICLLFLIDLVHYIRTN